MLKTLLALVVLVAWMLAGELPVGRAEREQVATAALLQVFSKAWPSERADYRMKEDDSWKSYARTLRAVVHAGNRKALTTGLQDENRQVRALCARALGYLCAGSADTEDCVSALVQVLKDDAWPTARLLAADSLGALSTPAARKELTAARSAEKQRDVVLHIDVALRRTKAPGKGYKRALLALTDADLGAATVGQAAPALELKTATGKAYSLSAYRGKKRVVLVFLYGDG